jgi:hypothetical protein
MRKGTRHRATQIAEALMVGDLEAVIKKVASKAKRGDMAAARLILDRVLPPRRGRPVRFPLPPIKTIADVVDALAAITAAVGRGEISTDEALQLSTVVEVAHNTIEQVELKSRLAALEERMGPK